MKVCFFVTVFLTLFKPSKGKLSLQRGEGRLKLGNFLHLHGHRLSVFILNTLEVHNEVQCSLTCLKSQDCLTVNVKKIEKSKFICEMLPTSKFQKPENLTRDAEYNHWYPKDISACFPSPCKFGNCSERNSGDEPYVCVCIPGVFGRDCNKFDSSFNFGLRKPTGLSTTLVNANGVFSSSLAVDGIKGTNCPDADGKPSCAHAERVTEPQWWRVDLMFVIPVARVGVTNRVSWAESLSNFEIKIGNSLINNGLNNPKCGDRHGVDSGLTKTITCSPPMSGRYVVIQSFYADRLVTLEVEVFAAA